MAKRQSGGAVQARDPKVPGGIAHFHEGSALNAPPYVASSVHMVAKGIFPGPRIDWRGSRLNHLVSPLILAAFLSATKRLVTLAFSSNVPTVVVVWHVRDDEGICARASGGGSSQISSIIT